MIELFAFLAIVAGGFLMLAFFCKVLVAAIVIPLKLSLFLVKGVVGLVAGLVGLILAIVLLPVLIGIAAPALLLFLLAIPAICIVGLFIGLLKIVF